MMNEEQIVEIWAAFKGYIDKKSVDAAAERYVDLLVDFGVEETELTAALGSDKDLDAAIHYYLEDEPEAEEPDDWE
jgi:hypothetical protein